MDELSPILEARVEQRPGYAYKLGQANHQFGLDSVFSGELDIDEKRMAAWITYADGSRRDGVGDLLEVGGIDDSRHRLNPIHLFDHGKAVTLPIGKVEDPETGLYTGVIDEAARVAKDLVFFWQGSKSIPAEMQAPGVKEYEHALFCQQVFHLLAQKYLRGGSIGYQVKHARRLQGDFEQGTPPGLHLLSVLKLESSTVVLPANGDTVRKMLAMPVICGKPPSPYLVKSLTPYAEEKKAVAVSGYEQKAQPEKSRGHVAFHGRKSIKELRGKYRKALQPESRYTYDVGLGPNKRPKHPQVGETVMARTYIGSRQGPPINPPFDYTPGPAAATGDRLEVLEVIDPEGYTTLRLRNKKTGVVFTATPREVRGKGLGDYPRKGFADIRRKIGTKGRIEASPEGEDKSDQEIMKAVRAGRAYFNGEKIVSYDPMNGWVITDKSKPKGYLSLPFNIEIKSLDLRRKYRLIKSVRRRVKRSSPGTSMVYVAGKDLNRLKDEAERKGLRFERAGAKDGLEKVKLTGDDGNIDAVAKMFGSVKRLEWAMRGKSLSGELWDLAGKVSRARMVPLPSGSINETRYGPQTKFTSEYAALCNQAIQLANKLEDRGDAEKIKKRASAPYDPMHNDSLAAALASAANSTSKSLNGAESMSKETKADDAATDKETGGDEPYDYGKEMHGAQLLRKAHADHSFLMQDYDDALKMLENERVKAHVEGHLGSVEKFLSSTEKLWDKEYKDAGYPPLHEEEADEDGEEAAEAKEKETEERPKAKDADTMDDAGNAAGSSGREDEVPDEEEAVEAMRTKSLPETRAKYGGKKTKAKKDLTEDEAAAVAGKLKRETADTEPEARRRHGKGVTGAIAGGIAGAATPIPGGAIMGAAAGSAAQDALSGKALEPHELDAVGKAAGFLKESEAAEEWTDEHRMNSFHYHKTLEGIGQLGEAHDDLENRKTDVPPAEFKPGAGAKGLPSEEADVSPEKARQILRDGEVHGKPLTEAQRGMFGAIAGRGKKDFAEEERTEGHHAQAGSPEWEEEEQQEPEHRKSIGQASGFFKELSQAAALDDSFRQRMGEVRKQLEGIGNVKEETEEDLVPDPGEMGEKAGSINRIKAFYDQQSKELDELVKLTKAMNGRL